MDERVKAEIDKLFPEERDPRMGYWASVTDIQLERIATLAAEVEREACAKVCITRVVLAKEGYRQLVQGSPDGIWADGRAACAAAIRARGQRG